MPPILSAPAALLDGPFEHLLTFMMELVLLFFKTILFRPYVFVFLAAFLFAAIKLIGWPRTWRFWLISWATAFRLRVFLYPHRHSLRLVSLQRLDGRPGALLLQRPVHGLDLVQFSALRRLLRRALPPSSNRAVPCFHSTDASNRSVLM